MMGERASQDPMVQRRRLRLELREARKGAQLTQKDVAMALDWSPSKVIRIESGSVGISTTDLKALLQHYGVEDGQRIDTLVLMAKSSRTPSWSQYRDLLNQSFITLLGHESSASTIRQHETAFVPGLLQLEEYGREIMSKVSQRTAEEVDRLWELREQRQRLHDREDPPEMFFILDEAVVRRQVGGARIMRRQLERLREFADRSHVDLRVIPFDRGAHSGMLGPFVILEFLDSVDSDLVFLEDTRGDSVFRDEEDETAQYLAMFLGLEEEALSGEASKTLLNGLIADPGDFVGVEPS
jgi:transcriptional regulator with XRE-family HTH domain